MGPPIRHKLTAFVFILKENKNKKPTNAVQNPIFQGQPYRPSLGVNPCLRPESSPHCAPLPSPASRRAAGSTSLEAQIQGQGRGGKTGRQLLSSLSPGLQPWLQVPTLALINPFLATLLGGEADLGNSLHTPLCPGACSGLSSLRLGAPSLPPWWERVVKSPGLNTLMKAEDGVGGGGFSSNKLLAFLFFSVRGGGGGAGRGLQGPSLPLLVNLILYEAVLA